MTGWRWLGACAVLVLGVVTAVAVAPPWVVPTPTPTPRPTPPPSCANTPDPWMCEQTAEPGGERFACATDIECEAAERALWDALRAAGLRRI